MASSDEMTEKEVKDFIKSILTSTPQVSTMQSVQRDYKALIGQGIPFLRLKYNSLEHFLKSIPDVCTVNGSGAFAPVFPVISEKIAHINKMVTQQRVSVKGPRKFTPPRRTRQPFSVPHFERPPRFGYSNYSFSPHNSSSSSGSGGGSSYMSLRPNQSNFVKIPNEQPRNVVSFANTNLANNKVAAQTPQQPKTVNATDLIPNWELPKQQNKPASQVVNDTPTEVKKEQLKIAHLSRNNVEKWNNFNNNEIPHNAPIGKPQNVESNQSYHQPKDPPSPSKDVLFEKSKEKLNNLLSLEPKKEEIEEDLSNVPKKIQVNLKILISQFPDGIWSAELPAHYRRLFKRELIFMDWGYTSLIEMCISLKHIFHYVRPGRDDFKLYDKSKPLPANVEKTYTIASYDVGEKRSNDEALPELDWSDFKGHIPEDVFMYGQEIPNQFVPEDTKVDSVLDVVVVEIYDPSKFWFYLGTSDAPAILDDLMDELQNFYNQPDNAKDYVIPPGAIKEGLYCVQIIYDEYHRAKIVRLLPDTTEYVRVLYIDNGTVCKAPTKGMCFLQSCFASVPAQAIRCRLANIIPNVKGHPWPRSCSDRFRALVNRRDTKIKISYVDWSEEYVCVFLADVTDANNIVYLNETLVKEGHALWDGETQATPFVMSNFKCKVQNIHLFPTFLELEYSLAPNASEMYSLAKMLVPLQFCIPQYFEPNEEILSDDDYELEEVENSFIETVRNHRKYTPINMIDVSAIVNVPPMDFDIFGDLKEEMIEFCNGMNLLENRPMGPPQGVVCSDLEEESSVNKTEPKPIERDVKDHESAQLLSQDRELSESIIKKLEKYATLDSESSTTSPDSKEDEEDLLTCLVPSGSQVGGSLHKKYLADDEIDERLILSTIVEQSENELDLSVASSSHKDILDSPEINIFDNPEAFENKSDASRHSDSPLTPQSFFLACENKILKCNSIEGGSDGLGFDSSNSTTAQSVKLENPFIFETTARGELFNSSRTVKSFAENDTEASNAGARRDLDLPFKSSLEDTKNNFIESLSLTNPFRQFLEDKNDYKPSIGTVKSAALTADYEPIGDTNTQTGYVSLKESDDHSSLDSDGSDYKVFVPKPSPAQTTKLSNGRSPSVSSTPLPPPTEPYPMIYTPPNFGRPPLGEAQAKMSIHAASFVPVGYHPQYPPPWFNGGYPIPPYPQWSNGANYPAPYPYGGPRPGTRPPPGFTAPQYQGSPIHYPQNHQYMPRMGPPMYPPPGPPVPFHRPMGPYAPIKNTANVPKERDFYEVFNEGLLKRNGNGNNS